MMSDDDNDGEMIFGDRGVLKLPDICLTGEEKPRKNPTQETWPDRESNSGALRDRRACFCQSHSGGHYLFIVKFILIIIIHALKFIQKNVEYFTSKPNAHGKF